MPTSAELLLPSTYLQLIARGLADDCGKNILMENAIKVSEDGSFVPTELVIAGYLDDLSSPLAPLKKLVIDPENGRFLFLPQPIKDIRVNYHYGFPAKIGAGTYKRIGFNEPGNSNLISKGIQLTTGNLMDSVTNLIIDSHTYGSVPNITGINAFTLMSMDEQRPFIRLESPWILEGSGEESELWLDGLWIGSSSLSKVVLKGTFKCVVIRNCTFDPGGDTDLKGNSITPVSLEINGNIDYLLIDSSIMGPVFTGTDGYIENTIIRDSIIQSVDPGEMTIDFRDGNVIMERVSVFGKIKLHQLQATETLLTGLADVIDTQHGCFRFSAAPAESILPRKYESYLFLSYQPHWFTSLKFGHPDYGQLSETSPPELSIGSENGCEIGAFNKLINPVKKESLHKKVEEYMPFGLVPIFLKET